jgi:EthD domain
MLKVHILSRRRSDMTHEQYVAYWRDVHAPLFASQPDVKRYVRHYLRQLTVVS